MIAGADARKNTVKHLHLRLARWYKAADLRHDRCQGDAAAVGALAAHVWPGDDDQTLLPVIETHVVRREFAELVLALDDRMAQAWMSNVSAVSVGLQ